MQLHSEIGSKQLLSNNFAEANAITLGVYGSEYSANRLPIGIKVYEEEEDEGSFDESYEEEMEEEFEEELEEEVESEHHESDKYAKSR